MSKLLFDEKSGKIQDVKFAYVKINKGSKKYESEETEYSVNVIVDKDTAKEMKKAFPKNKVRDISTEDFEEKYKFAPPYPDQDDQYVLNFKTNTHQKSNGEEVPYEWSSRPKVYVPAEDGKIKDVTREVRVANGSGGTVAFNVSNGKFGQIHHLSGVLVTDLIELEKRSQTPFGDVSDNPYEDMAEEYSQSGDEDVGF